MNHVIIASINVNSIRYKFEQIKLIVEKNVDILIVQETKLDDSFPDGQFLLDGFLPPFRKDRNKNGGGIMIFIREHTLLCLISVRGLNPFFSIFS